MKVLRVLVAEDDPLIGMLLGETLVEMGHDVCAIEATEAATVIAAVACRPDMIIVDVQLGGGSGVSAIEAIRRTWPVPHVFVSGNAAAVRGLRPGAVIIQKPYREADLVLAMHRALDATAAECRGSR